MKISACAKLNLSLAITGRAEDGYHLLETVMQEIDLADEISVERAREITVSCDTALPFDNTARKAAEEFFSFTGIRGGADIHIKKHIPSEAGLGGGSSDAAAVLKTLQKLYRAVIPEKDLLSIARKIGSDVPFFLTGGCAIVSGTGEKVRNTANNMECWYVLAKPRFGVSTAEAYRRYHECAGVKCDNVSVLRALEKGDTELYARAAKNALENAAFAINPDTAAIKRLMYDAEFAMMTGSGSCVFGIYKTKKAAGGAAERISADSHTAFCRVCRNVN